MDKETFSQFDVIQEICRPVYRKPGQKDGKFSNGRWKVIGFCCQPCEFQPYPFSVTYLLANLHSLIVTIKNSQINSNRIGL